MEIVFSSCNCCVWTLGRLGADREQEYWSLDAGVLSKGGLVYHGVSGPTPRAAQSGRSGGRWQKCSFLVPGDPDTVG